MNILDKSDDEIVEQLNEIEEETLSEDLKNKSSEEQVALIKEKTQEREKIKKEIAELAIKRETYIANQNTTETEDLNSAILKAVKTKAKAKNYNFK